MANTIRIKRRPAGGGSGAPSELANAELAFNEDTNILYYGTGTGGAGGSATQIIPIGGSGAFAQTDSPEFTGTPTAPTAPNGTNTTQIATTAFVIANSGLGSVTQVTATSPLSSTGGTTPDISIQQASIFQSGYISANDFNDFNNKAPTDSPAFTGTPTAPLFNVGEAAGSSIATLDSISNSRLNYLLPSNGDYSMNYHQINYLADPSLSTDAANKGYVDSVAQGLNVKASVIYATTADITLSGSQPIDGYYTGTGQRILVKNQNNSADNGIYIANDSGAWGRSPDADTWAELVSAFVFVEQGTVNADTGWVCTANQSGSLGDPITWVQFSAAGAYTAGQGLTLTGNQFSITDTGVTYGYYGDANKAIRIYVNPQGQITTATEYDIQIGTSQVTGLGTIATQNYDSVNITGGTIENLSVFNNVTIDGGSF